MELDNEVSGNGNSYTTEFRQYDPRLGRWKSLDPLMAQFPSLSPYCAFDNNPVYYIDPYGLSASTNGEPDVVVPRGGTVTDDRKNRDEILKNMEKVADGTIVKFVYEDGSEASYTYRTSNDGSGKGLWTGRYTIPNGSSEHDVVGYAGSLRTRGSEMNMGGEVPKLAKADPPTPEINNGGISDPDNGATNQAGQEVEKAPENNVSRGRPRLRARNPRPVPNPPPSVVATPPTPTPPTVSSTAKFVFRNDWFKKGTERNKAYSSLRQVSNYLKNNPTQGFTIHVYINSGGTGEGKDIVGGSWWAGTATTYSGGTLKAMAWGRYLTIRNILRKQMNDPTLTFPYTPHYNGTEHKFKVVPIK